MVIFRSDIYACGNKHPPIYYWEVLKSILRKESIGKGLDIRMLWTGFYFRNTLERSLPKNL